MNLSQLYFQLDPPYIRREPNLKRRKALRWQLTYPLLFRILKMPNSAIEQLARDINPFKQQSNDHEFFNSRQKQYASVLKSYKSQFKILGIQYFTLLFFMYRVILARTYVLSFTLVYHLQKWSPVKRFVISNAIILPLILKNSLSYFKNDINLYQIAVSDYNKKNQDRMLNAQQTDLIIQ